MSAWFKLRETKKYRFNSPISLFNFLAQEIYIKILDFPKNNLKNNRGLLKID